MRLALPGGSISCRYDEDKVLLLHGLAIEEVRRAARGHTTKCGTNIEALQYVGFVWVENSRKVTTLTSRRLDSTCR